MLFKSFMSRLKPVSLYDLLSRGSNTLGKESISRCIKEKRVLITGAGGSIGPEIVRERIKYDAKQIILLDHIEFDSYKMSEDII